MKRIVIDRRWSNSLLLSALIVGWTIVAAAVEFAFWSDLQRAPSISGWCVLLIGGGFFAGVLFHLLNYSLLRLALRAEFGDRIWISTMLSEREIPWSDVGRIVFRQNGTPLPARFTVKIVQTNGARIEIFANAQEGDALVALVGEKTLAAGWPGLPLWRTTVWAILGLGIVAVLTGLAIDVMLWRERLQMPAGAPVVKAVAFGIAIPLLGVASVAFALYHLIRRPIIIRPGVIRIKDAEALTARAIFRQLFGQFD
jgi:hypothetical protein